MMEGAIPMHIHTVDERMRTAGPGAAEVEIKEDHVMEGADMMEPAASLQLGP